jgi:hypothetical protein
MGLSMLKVGNPFERNKKLRGYVRMTQIRTGGGLLKQP